MIQVKEFSDTFFYDCETGKSTGRSLEKRINQFLKNNPDIELIDIKYSQATNGYSVILIQHHTHWLFMR